MSVPSYGLPDVRQEVITRYISTSPGIHLWSDQRHREAFIRTYEWHLKGWLPEDRSGCWLDLGCGQGQLMSLALRNGYRDVRGADLSAEMLSACRELGLNVRLGDAAEIVRESRASTCGVVSAFDFLEHLSRNDAFALLRAARRLLTPAGVMLLKLPNGASPAVGDMFFSDLTHESLFTPASITQLASLAGFSACDVREVGPMPHGVRSTVRYVLWKAVRRGYRLVNAIETGSPGADVVTQVMLVRLTA